MKKIVFAIVLGFSAVASAQYSMDLPSLWWPEEFTGKSEAKVNADVALIMSSKNLANFMKQNGFGGNSIDRILVAGKNKYVVMLNEICSVDVVVRAKSNPSVLPVAGTLACGE